MSLRGIRLEAPEAARARRLLAIGLGILWTADGLLQLQPQMFTGALAVAVADSSMSLPPAIYFASLKFVDGFILGNVAAFNFGVAAIQLCLGVSILAGGERARRAALAVSIVWALAIWVLGEGMAGVLGATMAGGIFPGTPSIVSGFPGAALLYAVAAALLLVPERRWRLSGRFSPIRDVPAVIFILSAAVQAAPLMWTTYGQLSIFASNTGSLPSGLAGGALHLEDVSAAYPAMSNLLEVVACLVAGLGLLRLTRWGLAFALSWLGFIWVFPLALAGLFTGIGTDPNTPPAIALLMVPAVLEIQRRARQCRSKGSEAGLPQRSGTDTLLR